MIAFQPPSKSMTVASYVHFVIYVKSNTAYDSTLTTAMIISFTYNSNQQPLVDFCYNSGCCP